MLANSVRKVKQIAEILPRNLELTVLSSQSRVVDSLNESGIGCSLLEESLTSQGLGVLNHVHDLVLQAIGEGNLASGEQLLVVLAEPLDGVIVVDTSNLNSNRFATLAHDHNIDLEVLTKMMQLARHIGSRGREGHAIGHCLLWDPFLRFVSIQLPLYSIHSKAILQKREVSLMKPIMKLWQSLHGSMEPSCSTEKVLLAMQAGTSRSLKA